MGTPGEDVQDRKRRYEKSPWTVFDHDLINAQKPMNRWPVTFWMVDGAQIRGRVQQVDRFNVKIIEMDGGNHEGKELWLHKQHMVIVAIDKSTVSE